MTKLIVNCITGEVVERELNAEELAQQVIDEAASQAAQIEAESKAVAKASAEAKLAALGLSADEIAALSSK